MANVKVVTDSVADIPPELMKELDITSIPCIVRFGDSVFHDRIDLSLREFYQRLTSSNDFPATSQPAIGEFEDTYHKLAETTDGIISIHLVGALSGTVNTAQLAAKNIQNAAIEVIDSQQVTMALGWLVILAARAAKQGLALAEVKTLVQGAIPRARVIAMLDTLEYAQRGGRLGKGAALVGTLLNLKPLLSIVRGEIAPVENVRTKKRALARLVEIVLGSGPIQELAVIHADAEEEANQVRNELANALPNTHILLTETGPVLGTHVGPGAVGVAWLAGK